MAGELMDWWLIVRTPAGVYVRHLGDPDDATRQAAVDAAKTAHAVPADWFDSADWDVQLAPGEPHPSLMGRATVE